MCSWSEIGDVRPRRTYVLHLLDGTTEGRLRRVSIFHVSGENTRLRVAVRRHRIAGGAPVIRFCPHSASAIRPRLLDVLPRWEHDIERWTHAAFRRSDSCIFLGQGLRRDEWW